MDDVLTETVSVSESDLESLSASFHIHDSEPASIPEPSIQLSKSWMLVRFIQVLHHLLSSLKPCDS